MKSHMNARTLTAILGTCGLAIASLTHAQDFHSSFNGPVFSKGSTEFGDYYRGIGAMYYGHGAQLHGWGAAATGFGRMQESCGRFQIAHQEARALSLDNAYREHEIRRAQQAERAELIQVRRQREADLWRTEQLARYRDRPSTAAVSTGAAINFLLEELQDDAVDAAPLLRQLGPTDLEAVRLQTRGGVSLVAGNGPFDLQGNVNWPRVLQDEKFQYQRSDIEGQLRKLLQDLSDGLQVDSHASTSLDADLAGLESAAKHAAAAEGPRCWSELRNFVRAARDKVTRLPGHEGQALIDGRLAIQPIDAQELLNHVVAHDLRIAPATGEATVVYAKLHAALARIHRNRTPATLAAR